MRYQHYFFLLAKMPLNHLLRKCTRDDELYKSQEKSNHLIYMDNIKLFAKNEKKKSTLYKQ